MTAALRNLRLTRTQWVDGTSTLEALGVLDPFFRDHPNWDLPRQMMEVAETSQLAFPRVPTAELAIYTMLYVAKLPETDVARALGVAPGEAYQRASRFRLQLDADPALSGYVTQYVERVVASFMPNRL